MSLANDLEQQMLDLINLERSKADLAPLTFNGVLNDASEDHSSWMLDTDTFSHSGENGSSAGDRIVDAGYALEGNWTWGENIGWQSERGDPGLEDDVADIHQSLMNSPGHRANILNPDFDEIGIGIERGDFDGYDSVMVTQNFGATDAVFDDPDDEQPPISEDPVPDAPDDETPPVSDNPDGETPDPEEPPVAEEPDDEPPAEEEPPVADTPDDDTPEEEPPVAENPDPETPGDDEPPVADNPDDDTPDDETPVAENPDPETPDVDEPPVTDDPVEEAFDLEQLFSEISDFLNDLIDGFEFLAFNDCDVVDMEDDLPLIDDMPPPEDMPTVDDDSFDDDMDFTCGDWPDQDVDLQFSVNLTFNFDFA